MQTRLSVALLLLVFCLSGCASSAWRAARASDTPSDYHRFLRQHGDSEYAAEARERLAMARVRSQPTREAFDAFLEAYPDSPLVAELRPYVEEQFFVQARARGTAAAYREFLLGFPNGTFASRARGNAEYLEQGGFGGRLSALSDFAERYPASDYAAEAQRSVAASELRRTTAFRRVGLLMDIPSGTPGADRLARVFAERAASAYQKAGLELVALSSLEDPRLSTVSAYLGISHREQQVKTKVAQGGNVSQSGILARTSVTLAHLNDDEPIWSDTFEFRVPASEQRPGVSIVFGAGSANYWSEFFVPVASWNTRHALREGQSFQKPAVAVAMAGSRAVVLFGDGDLEVLDVADPANPALIAEYRRARDLARFEGLTLAAGRVVTYGPDGIEIVRFGPQGLERAAVYGRDAVGSIVGVEAFGDELVAAGNRGLLWIGPSEQGLRRLVSQEIRGLSRLGERLLFTDGVSLHISTLPLLEARRTEGELRMGRGFGPSRVHAAGVSAVVMGDRGTAWVDVSAPSTPRLRSRVDAAEVGEVRDAVVVGGRLFLLGPRGLQVSDPSGERVVDSADVEAIQRLQAAGRHLVMVGDNSLQVVDTTPFFAADGAAAPR
jgi:hypothetical protein